MCIRWFRKKRAGKLPEIVNGCKLVTTVSESKIHDLEVQLAHFSDLMLKDDIGRIARVVVDRQSNALNYTVFVLPYTERYKVYEYWERTVGAA
jgi:hypothetical protein